jgi:hypothetical protein
MKTNTLKQIVFFLCIMGILFSSLSVSAATDRSSEISSFLTMLESSSVKTRIDAAKQITRSGLTDPELFNRIEEKLLTGYTQNPNNSKHVDEMSWLCKSLASSGNMEYLEILTNIGKTSTSEKLKRYAKQSASQLAVHAERNRLLADTTNMDASLSPEVNRYITMLRSNDPVLKRDAAKSIHRNHFTEEKLYDVVSDELLKGYPLTSPGNRNYTDALAWMCKALTSSGMTKYRTTLTEIIEKSTSETLKRHASKSLRMLK